MACCTSRVRWSFLLIFLLNSLVFVLVICDKSKDKHDDNVSQKWKKKHLSDYSDADMERLYDQWEDSDEDELEEDELPEWKREPPKIDLSQADPSDPEGLLKMSKMGRTLMMFASVSGNPTEKETEDITQIWQSSLFNANFEIQRYVVGQDRVIFMLKDGAKAWEIKDFLVSQDRCSEVTIEGKNYPGKGASMESPDDNRTSQKDKKSKKKVKKDKVEL